jgi:hypothetical protein
MDHKRPKYMPDVQKVLRDCEPEVLEARTRKAIQKVYEAGLIDRLTPEPAPDRARRESAPSPWAKDGSDASAGGIDKEALPSAMVPAPSPPAEERPVTKRVGPVEAMQRRWPQSWKLVGAAGLVAVMAAPVTLAVLAWRTREPVAKVAAASAAPAVVTEVPSVTGMTLPRPTTMPSAEPAPSVTAAASATVAPILKPQGKPQATTANPHDAATPIAPPTAAPVVTVAPVVTADPAVTLAATASAAAPSVLPLLRKREP